MSLSRRLAAVDAVLERAVAQRRVPGVVALVTDRSGVRFESAHGLASVRDARPMRTETVFRIASMTKPLTSVAVLMLAEEDKLGLDDPLARHLPGYTQPPVLVSFDESTCTPTTRPAGRDVTIRDLLTHTSGYGYWFLDRPLLAADGGRDYFRAPFLMHDPGERFSYGISTDVLAQVVEPVSGLALGRFFEERITRPLRMLDSSFVPPAEPERLVGLHVREGDGFDDAPNETRGDAPRGGGGLYSTARDYAAFLRMLLNGGVSDGGERLLAASSVAAMTANRIGSLSTGVPRSTHSPRTLDFAFLDGTQKFGYNLMIETRERAGYRAAGSWGWAGIRNTFFWGDPRAGVGAVLMMQLRPFCEPQCLAVLDEFERAVYAALTA